MSSWIVQTLFQISEIYDENFYSKYNLFEIQNLYDFSKFQEKLLNDESIDESLRPKFLWSYYDVSNGYKSLRTSIPITGFINDFIEIECIEIPIWDKEELRIKYYTFEETTSILRNYLAVDLTKYRVKDSAKFNYLQTQRKDSIFFDIDASYDFDKFVIGSPELFKTFWMINDRTGKILEKKLYDYVDFERRNSNKWYQAFYLIESKVLLNL